MSPYYEGGKTIPRVTEVVAAGDCEATANIEKNQKLRSRPRTRHSVTLPGTLTHAKIEQQLNRVMGKTQSSMYLDGLDKKLFAKIYTQHKKMKKKNTNAHTTYDDLMDKVNDCYANYLAFIIDHPIKPLLVEKRMFSPHYGVGGTVDVVALEFVKGYSISMSPDPGFLPKKRYWKACDHKGNCQCHKKQIIIVLDWKTSTRSQTGHRKQMSAYFCMLEEKGILDEYRRKDYYIGWETWSVLLGPHTLKKTKTPYQVKLYDPSVADFLVCWEAHQNARYLTINLKEKTGLKGRCMFCGVLPTCPDRLMWNIGGEIEFQTSFTQVELARIALALNGKKSFQDVADKVNDYLAESKLMESEIESAIPIVLHEFETKLDILVTKSDKKPESESK